MSHEINEDRLLDLLNGDLTESEERELEVLIMANPAVRQKWEQLTGSLLWPVGSAPKPDLPTSALFSYAIDRLRSRLPVGDRIRLTPNIYSTQYEELLQQLNDELKGFKVIREIGRGGMGVVFEAIDETLHRRVAVKVLKPLRSDDLTTEDQLLSEAQSIAALQHENILTVFSVQFVLGKPVLIEQFVDGESLQKRLDNVGALPILECISIALQIARGLAAAHSQGIVHRDLKPDNVMIDKQSNTIRICDFGLAQRHGVSPPNLSGFLAGTPSYMSPEQIMGEQTLSSSDLFSLGVILYVMVTGVVPFADDDPKEVFAQLKNKIVEPARTLRHDTPIWLSKLIGQLLEKDPKERIASANEVVALLESGDVSYKSAFNTKRIASALVIALLSIPAILALIFNPKLSVVHQQSNHLMESSPIISQIEKRGVWIEGHDENYLTLAQAIEAAIDGDVIFLDRDIADSGIQVVGKNLSIVAWPGTHPTITHAQEQNHAATYLLRTDQDLTLRGLRINWKPLNPIQIFEEGQLSNIVSTFFNTNLKVEDCEFETTQLGTILGLGGNAHISNTKFSGELFGLGCMLHGNRIEVRNCDFRCRSALAVLYPPPQRAVADNTDIDLIDSKFEGNAVIDVVLVRKAIVGIHVRASGCFFQSENKIVLTRSGNKAPDLDSFKEVKAWTHRLIKWQETKCNHAKESDFLSGRSLRQLNNMISEFQSLQEWKDFWASAPGGDSFVDSPMLND